MLTSEWPCNSNPFSAPFVVRQFLKLKENNIAVDILHVKGSANLFNYIKNWEKILINKKMTSQ